MQTERERERENEHKQQSTGNLLRVIYLYTHRKLNSIIPVPYFGVLLTAKIKCIYSQNYCNIMTCQLIFTW